MGWLRPRMFHALGLSFVLAAAAACGGTKKDPLTPSGEGGEVAIGKPAPDFSIQTINGKGTVSLESLKGKVIVLDFWATWCGPCKESFPALEKLQKTNSDNVTVVGISVDDEDVKEDGVKDFAKEHGATFAIGWDPKKAIAKSWPVDKMPTTFIIDTSGTVRHIHAGYHDGEMDTVEKELVALQAEGPSKSAKTEAASSPAPKAETPETKPEATGEPAEPAEPATKPKKGGKPGKPKGGGKKPGAKPKK